jgi:retron-type reverse transcriptase
MLGMPTIEDKVLQRAIAMLLEPIYWERMHRLLQFYYLPNARIVHSVYAAKP